MLLNGWMHRSIEGHKIDNGFHGIELPRGNDVKEILYKLTSKENYVEIENERYLMIQDDIVSFKSGIKEWPLTLRQELNEIIGNPKVFESLTIHQQMNRLSESRIMSLCNDVFDRYADKIEDCWNLLYPWFYPKEFLFDGNDEGTKFQGDVRSGLIKASYLKPKDNLFSNISVAIESRLEDMGIEVQKEVKIDLEKLEELSNDGLKTTIWTASSYSLLKMIKPELAEDCIGGVRHMHLFYLKKKN